MNAACKPLNLKNLGENVVNMGVVVQASFLYPANIIYKLTEKCVSVEFQSFKKRYFYKTRC